MVLKIKEASLLSALPPALGWQAHVATPSFLDVCWASELGRSSYLCNMHSFQLSYCPSMLVGEWVGGLVGGLVGGVLRQDLMILLSLPPKCREYNKHILPCPIHLGDSNKKSHEKIKIRRFMAFYKMLLLLLLWKVDFNISKLVWG